MSFPQRQRRAALLQCRSAPIRSPRRHRPRAQGTLRQLEERWINKLRHLRGEGESYSDVTSLHSAYARFLLWAARWRFSSSSRLRARPCGQRPRSPTAADSVGRCAGPTRRGRLQGHLQGRSSHSHRIMDQPVMLGTPAVHRPPPAKAKLAGPDRVEAAQFIAACGIGQLMPLDAGPDGRRWWGRRSRWRWRWWWRWCSERRWWRLRSAATCPLRAGA